MQPQFSCISLHITNMHRFPSNFLISQCISCRFFNNAFYARVGGINTIEMNRLELDLLFNLDFGLKVNLETFGSYCLQLEKHAPVSPQRLPVQVHCVK